MIETLFTTLAEAIAATVRDVLPIAAIIAVFQFVILRRRLARWRQAVAGLVYVVLGLALFSVGLEQALFPLGRVMAAQLTAPEFVTSLDATGAAIALVWSDYAWVYVFAAAIGFATTIAEPSLIAVAIKANDVSGGVVGVWGLRVAVAVGVAVGVALGTFRIVTGGSLHLFIMAGYIMVLLQTLHAPRAIMPLAYDSGGVTTSTVTVPLVAALGLGLASTIPGRSPLIDGFGLIAFASVFPIISVLGYAQLSSWWHRRAGERRDS